MNVSANACMHHGNQDTVGGSGLKHRERARRASVEEEKAYKAHRIADVDRQL